MCRGRIRRGRGSLDDGVLDRNSFEWMSAHGWEGSVDGRGHVTCAVTVQQSCISKREIYIE